MNMVISALVSAALGFGFTRFIQSLNIAAIQPNPSSLPFMLLSLLVITIIYQARTNGARGWPISAPFSFGPPTPSILIETGAFFVGSLAALDKLTISR